MSLPSYDLEILRKRENKIHADLEDNGGLRTRHRAALVLHRVLPKRSILANIRQKETTLRGVLLGGVALALALSNMQASVPFAESAQIKRVPPKTNTPTRQIHKDNHKCHIAEVTSPDLNLQVQSNRGQHVVRIFWHRGYEQSKDHDRKNIKSHRHTVSRKSLRFQSSGLACAEGDWDIGFRMTPDAGEAEKLHALYMQSCILWRKSPSAVVRGGC